jgi:hypothetical protein
MTDEKKKPEEDELTEEQLKDVAGGAMDAEMGFSLQQVMERRTQYVQMMSNIMKKMSTTQDSIVQNMK